MAQIESQDHDLEKQEEKENRDNEIHQGFKDAFEMGLYELYCEMNLNEIPLEDIIKITKNALEESQDIKVEIEEIIKCLN